MGRQCFSSQVYLSASVRSACCGAFASCCGNVSTTLRSSIRSRAQARLGALLARVPAKAPSPLSWSGLYRGSLYGRCAYLPQGCSPLRLLCQNANRHPTNIPPSPACTPHLFCRCDCVLQVCPVRFTLIPWQAVVSPEALRQMLWSRAIEALGP